MDRWSDRDSLAEDAAPKAPAGMVARLGMGGFVKSDTAMGAKSAEVTGKIEIVSSRREQKKDQARVLMPPPPALPGPPRPAASAGPASGPSAFPAPPWAGVPPPGYTLDVAKGGETVQQIPMDRPAHLFGRGANADTVLEHASISRQHAAVCYNARKGAWQVLDLGATHGTFVDGRPVPKNGTTDLLTGQELRFGASTRQYTLRKTEVPDLPHKEEKRKRGVQWPDEVSESKRGRADLPPLEKVIGYSDSRDFAVGVGPKPAGPAEGLFANLVQPVIVRKPPAADAADPASPTSEGAKAAPSVPAGVKKPGVLGNETKNRTPIVQPLAGRRALLYDWLPPVKGEKREGAGVSAEASKAYQVSLKEKENEGEVEVGRESLGVVSEASKAAQVRLKEKGAVGEGQEVREDGGNLVKEAGGSLMGAAGGSVENPALEGRATDEDMFAEAGAHE